MSTGDWRLLSLEKVKGKGMSLSAEREGGREKERETCMEKKLNSPILAVAKGE